MTTTLYGTKFQVKKFVAAVQARENQANMIIAYM
jgi:hypothetical protein